MESAIGDPTKACDSPNGSLFRWFVILVGLSCVSGLVMYQTDREYIHTVPLLRESARSQVACGEAERLFQAGRFAEAHGFFASAARLDERNPTAWIGRAKSDYQLQHFELAKRATIFGLLLCQEASPFQRSEFWYYQALAEFGKKDVQGAKSSLRVCLNVYPAHSGASEMLSRLQAN